MARQVLSDNFIKINESCPLAERIRTARTGERAYGGRAGTGLVMIACVYINVRGQPTVPCGHPWISRLTVLSCRVARGYFSFNALYELKNEQLCDVKWLGSFRWLPAFRIISFHVMIWIQWPSWTWCHVTFVVYYFNTVLFKSC